MGTMPEPRLLDEVADRVHDRLPGVAVEVIAAEVSARFEAYADCRVRDFLPILVEREVVARIAGRGTVLA